MPLGRSSAARGDAREACLAALTDSPVLACRQLGASTGTERRQPGTPRLPSEGSADAPHEAATGTSCPHLPPRERSHGNRGRARPASRSAWSHRSVACAAKGCLLHPHPTCNSSMRHAQLDPSPAFSAFCICAHACMGTALARRSAAALPRYGHVESSGGVWERSCSSNPRARGTGRLDAQPLSSPGRLIDEPNRRCPASPR
ncbi:hypothetical protein FA09DRAFT_135350 [Tilletiopsis washingtonensis]|uniref:Uncharacterized protein n=1 Tax=Tilletiopsis washingtonensis TaxID=58919 RepID=A0A316Z271_9BASI|nr:hypothetical protein FA09DRAFT_135350 [Tilletiopsis washingtonensis]PWN95631.1 hypothetical protein FA09DRAFT_135350 [Tilletiopsis washingtonensis]